MNTKVWLHSIAAAAIGGSASALGLIVVSPDSVTWTWAGGFTLLKVALIGAIVPVLALLKQSPMPEPDTAAASIPTQKLGALALCSILLMGSLTGCTSSQVSTVVKNIATYAQEAQPIITEVLALVAAFSASDSGSTSSTTSSLTTASTAIKTDLANLVTLCNTYTSNPSTSTWQQIIAMVDDLVTNGDSALVELAAIKSTSSQEAAFTVLATLDALLHTIDGFVQTTETTAEVKATAHKRAIKLHTISRYWSERDKQQMSTAFGRDFSTLYSYETAQGL